MKEDEFANLMEEIKQWNSQVINYGAYRTGTFVDRQLQGQENANAAISAQTEMGSKAPPTNVKTSQQTQQINASIDSDKRQITKWNGGSDDGKDPNRSGSS